jgi:hypothetical protein
VAEIVALMREYGCRQLTGDNYGASWVSEASTKAGVPEIAARPFRRLSRHAIHLGARPLARQPASYKPIRILGAPDIFDGRERIDPDPGHDDLANSAAISMSLAAVCAAPLSFHAPFSDARARAAAAQNPGLPDVVMDVSEYENPACPSRDYYVGGWARQYASLVEMMPETYIRISQELVLGNDAAQWTLYRPKRARAVFVAPPEEPVQ